MTSSLSGLELVKLLFFYFYFRWEYEIRAMKIINRYYIFLLFVIFIIINHSLAIVIIKSQFLISSPQTNNENQTIHLLNKTELSLPPNRPINIVESIPGEVASLFDLFEINEQAYLTFRNSSSRNQARFTNCVLLLSNDIAVNVTFTERYAVNQVEPNEADENDEDGLISDDDYDPDQQARFAVEYIFKLSNRSRFGLIKDDTPVNGILCIVRIFDTFSNQTDLDQVDLRIGSDYFQVRII